MSSMTALIVAAGSGRRFGGTVPKQYLELGGMPVLRRGVMAFLKHPAVDQVRVVINDADRAFYDKAVAGLGLPEPVSGGASRQESVLRGLEALDTHPSRLVLIHDAARPLIDAATIQAIRDALEEWQGAIAATPLIDTLKRGIGGRVEATIDRAGLWLAQTPQGFHYADILAAYRSATDFEDSGLTDDAAVAEKAGIPVTLVPASAANMKITSPEDLQCAAHMLEKSMNDVCTGFGYDAHRLIEGEGVILCGVRIPHDRKLEGHSDADVVLHAVADAIYGALGAGDIGLHFPDSDPQWRDHDSGHFVRHAVELSHARGGVIGHVDVTIFAERPRIAPHRAAMIARLSALLDIAPGRVGLKATTMEKLGFIGREEGLAAQAVATIRLPEGRDDA